MDLNALLNPVKGTLKASVIRYDGTFPTVRADERIVENTGQIDFAEHTDEHGGWRCSWKLEEMSNPQDVAELTITFKRIGGPIRSAGVAVQFVFDEWSVDNYVLLPAAVYNGNRFDCKVMSYPPLFRDKKNHRIDLPTTITDIPRLNITPGPSRLEQTTGDLSTPAMGFYSPSKKQAFWILTTQQTRFGNSGLTVEESADRSSATFSISAPCVRREQQYMACRKPSDDRAVDWNDGDEVTLNIQLCSAIAWNVQTLFDRFMTIRKNLNPGTCLSNVLPFSESWRLLEEKYNRDNWRESYGLYTVGTVDVICGIWQLGWVGGGMVTQPLLMAGSEPSQERACRNLDTIIHRSQAPSGLFYGAGDGKNWYSDAFADPHPDRMVMIRKNADWLYFLGKQIKLLSTLRFGWTLPEHWKTAYRRLADAFVNLWNRYGQLGQFADVETGELVVGMTTSGVMASGGLMLAAEILNDPKYLEVAEQSARLYYGRDVKTGITNAGPGEILQAPDSESAFAALESFIVLYEGTKKREWLLAATDTARQCATWCVSYDYQFPPESLFAKLDIRTTGAVYANAQNKHGAPGICTLSGDSLLKLFRATGDAPRYCSHGAAMYFEA
jgi:hypothetical protein